VADRQDQAGDAQPLVQAVHLVESAQRALKKDRAHGEQHGQAHHADAQDARVLVEYVAPGEQPVQAVQSVGSACHHNALSTTRLPQKVYFKVFIESSAT